MNYEFMRQVAPLIAIPPDEDGGSGSQGSWITPEQGSNQPIYGGADSNGERMPLPYIRDQGGPTQYYSPSGTAGLSTVGPPVPAVARSAPTPIQGIRGRTPEAPIGPAFNISAPQVTPPENLMATPASPDGRARFGDHDVLGMPNDAPPNGLAGITAMPNYGRLRQEQLQRTLPETVRNPIMGVHGQLRSPAEMDEWDRYRAHQRDPLYQGAQGRLSIPPEGRSQAAPQYNPHDQTDRQRAQPNGANTLFDMFDQAGFRPPQFLLDLTGRGRTMGEEVGRAGAQPVQDLRGPQANVQRTSSNRGGIPSFSTDQGLAEFNYRMFGGDADRYLGSQVRTQAQQDDLYNRHLTTTRNSAHIGGAAYDYPGSRLSGRRGREAIVEVQRQMTEAGYDINQLEFRWESGRGRGQGTGPHVHVEPK
jgi:hypothetical protein